MHPIVLTSIESLHQVVEFIQQEHELEPITEPLCQLLDRYQALIKSEHNQLDYDVNPSALNLSQSKDKLKPVQVLKELVDIESWLMALKVEDFNTVMIVKMTLGKAIPSRENLTSTLARELCDAYQFSQQQLELMKALMRVSKMKGDNQLLADNPLASVPTDASF